MREKCGQNFHLLKMEISRTIVSPDLAYIYLNFPLLTGGGESNDQQATDVDERVYKNRHPAELQARW